MIKYFAHPTSIFPLRDLCVLENTKLSCDMDVLEVGVGSGETTVRLSLEVKNILGVDISEDAIRSLAYLKNKYRNLDFLKCDVTQDGLPDATYDLIVSCDTLEHVENPKAYFSFICDHLRSQGKALVLFPNEPPPGNHGVTYFESINQLKDAISEGYSEIEIFEASISKWSKCVSFIFYESLSKIGKWLFRSGVKEEVDANMNPQSFEQTDYYKRQVLWRKLSPIINFYWWILLLLCKLGGRSYKLERAADETFSSDSTIVVKLTK